MKVSITEDEWFPVFDIEEPRGRPWDQVFEVDDALVKRHKKVMAEFIKVQDLLLEAIKRGEYK